MRRADRLFQIIQLLRRARGPVTASDMAAELETSRRTLYRDIATLMAQRVPIRGEAGVGYVLDKGFDLPPLMLTPEEIEVVVLGAQWVGGLADPSLAKAADDLIAKVTAVVPEHLQPLVLDPVGRVRPTTPVEPDPLDMAGVRASIRVGRKMRLRYVDESGAQTERTVWPVAIGYVGPARILVAWCELRNDFRHFRADRIAEAQFTEERYPQSPGALRRTWRRQQIERLAAAERAAAAVR